MKKLSLFALGAFAAVLPKFAFAVTEDVTGLITLLQNILNKIVPLLIAFLVVMLVWGIVRYTTSADEEAQEKAKGLIIWSVLGVLFIMIFWGIIALLKNTVALPDDKIGDVELPFPCVDDGPGGVEC